VNAFLAVEIRHAVFARRDGLAAAQLDANLRAALLAEFRAKEDDENVPVNDVGRFSQALPLPAS
jgi:hypothetical protein